MSSFFQEKEDASLTLLMAIYLIYLRILIIYFIHVEQFRVLEKNNALNPGSLTHISLTCHPAYFMPLLGLFIPPR